MREGMRLDRGPDFPPRQGRVVLRGSTLDSERRRSTCQCEKWFYSVCVCFVKTRSSRAASGTCFGREEEKQETEQG